METRKHLNVCPLYPSQYDGSPKDVLAWKNKLLASYKDQSIPEILPKHAFIPDSPEIAYAKIASSRSTVEKKIGSNGGDSTSPAFPNGISQCGEI